MKTIATNWAVKLDNREVKRYRNGAFRWVGTYIHEMSNEVVLLNLTKLRKGGWRQLSQYDTWLHIFNQERIKRKL